ncbi:MAG: RnfABCDGE type electron transport complex subunit D [Deltaproteobacteria bacterium]|nr:RnfABCDGE type electron transport complex subunit D [Deltaproteobacteria bacterium]
MRFVELPKDPRLFQIAVLGSLLLYGVLELSFTLPPIALLATPLFACVVERLTFRFRAPPGKSRPPYESSIIASLSTMLLLRSTEAWVYAVSVSFAVATKAFIRVRGRHFLNPTNAGVLFAASFLPGWVASGQWGHNLVLVFALLSGGLLVLSRAGRLDSAFAFLLGLVAAQLTRIWVFGYRPATLTHLFENGAVWLFALYMITDPRTTPSARSARVVHAIFVAFLALGMVQFFYKRDAILWALLMSAPLIPIFDFVTQKLAEPSSSKGDSSNASSAPVHA